MHERVTRRVAAAMVVLAFGALAAPGGVADAQEAPAGGATTRPAEPTQLTVAAVMSGEVRSVTGTASGGFGGGESYQVHLSVQNRTTAPITLVIPRATLFASDDDSEQVGVTSGPKDEEPPKVSLTAEPTVTLRPGKNTIELSAYCAQHLDLGPNGTVPLHYAGVAEAPLPRVMANIVAQQPSHETAQDAVWWVTDDPETPIPAEIAPLLAGVDTKAFAAAPKQVVVDPKYTPMFKGGTRHIGLPTFEPPSRARSGTSSKSGATTTAVILVGVAFLIGMAVFVLRSSASSRPATAVTGIPPGWHPDPGNPSQLRYWDGSQWTAAVRRR